MTQIPSDVDQPSGSPGGVDDRLSDIELRLLDAGAKARENINREADQRYSLRWLAVVVVVALIVGLGIMLYHTTHQLFASRYFEQPAAYVIAIFVAPIVSATALSLGLLVAAFRGFKGKEDVDQAATIANGARSAIDGGL